MWHKTRGARDTVVASRQEGGQSVGPKYYAAFDLERRGMHEAAVLFSRLYRESNKAIDGAACVLWRLDTGDATWFEAIELALDDRYICVQ